MIQTALRYLIVACMLLSTGALAKNAVEDECEARSIGLALGSGGAGGLAHIAMLGVFDDLGIQPDRITGSSIGAVIGALYAAGLDAEAIEDIFDDFGGSNLDALSHMMRPNAELGLTDLLRIGLGDGGLIDSSGFLDFIAGKIEARDFADLKIPLEVVATDYWTGEMTILDSGDLFMAIKASMAVPGLFAPVKVGDKLLIDGGTSNPLPYDILVDRYDLVVAIDVSGARKRIHDKQPSITEMLFSTFEIMQQSIITSRRLNGDGDIYIKPNTEGIRLLHFNRIETILKQAKPAAAELREKLVEHLGLEN